MLGILEMTIHVKYLTLETNQTKGRQNVMSLPDGMNGEWRVVVDWVNHLVKWCTICVVGGDDIPDTESQDSMETSLN